MKNKSTLDKLWRCPVLLCNKAISFKNEIKKHCLINHGSLPEYLSGYYDALKQKDSKLRGKIGMLRQWLNEDRITDPKKMITNADIKFWLLEEKTSHE